MLRLSRRSTADAGPELGADKVFCQAPTRQKLKDEEEIISCCRVCGRYHLFGVTEIIPSCSTRA